MNGNIWSKSKNDISAEIIDRFEHLAPKISDKILIKEIATPTSLYNYTLNSNGAMHGWASTIKQTNCFIIRPKTNINGLYITGHWITQLAPGGTPMAAASGRNTARLIFNNERKTIKRSYYI